MSVDENQVHLVESRDRILPVFHRRHKNANINVAAYLYGSGVDTQQCLKIKFYDQLKLNANEKSTNYVAKLLVLHRFIRMVMNVEIADDLLASYGD